MPLNFGLGGKTYEPVTRTIAAEEIARYARASGDDNPAHAVGPDQVASPIFPVVPGLPLIGVVTLDPELGVDNPLMIVHGEHEIRHYRPMRAGQTVVFTPSLVSVEDKGKGATFTARVEAATPDGEPVNEQTATIFVRGAGSGAERPKSAEPDPAPGERSAPLAEFSSHVAADMPVRYAEASGDHNPIHLDPDVAAAVGLPGPINHGLGTLSLVTAGLVREVAQGDPTRIATVRVRFTDMVFPGSDLTTVVWPPDGGRGHAFETARPDGAVAMSGLVEVR